VAAGGAIAPPAATPPFPFKPVTVSLRNEPKGEVEATSIFYPLMKKPRIANQNSVALFFRIFR